MFSPLTQKLREHRRVVMKGIDSAAILITY